MRRLLTAATLACALLVPGACSEPRLLPPPTIAVTVDPDSALLRPGSTLQLTAIVSGTADSRVTWSSSDPSVVTVTDAGLVRAQRAGEAVVSATLLADRSRSAEARIVVLPPITLDVDPTVDTLAVGQTAPFVATLGEALDQRIIWRSSNTAVFEVDADGVVLAVAPGSATLTVLAVEDTTVRATASIEVIPEIEIELSTQAATLLLGESVQLEARLVGARDRSVHWSSSAPDVAGVDQTGLVRALRTGSAIITATANADPEARASAAIVVLPPGLSVLAGDGQTGLAGSALADSLVVLVASPDGRRAPGVRVRWDPGATGGVVEPTESLTDADGIARARWVLPHTLGPASVSVRAGGHEATFTATAVGPAPLPMLEPDTINFLSAVGTVRTAVFLIDFADAVAGVTPDEAYAHLLEPAASMFDEFSAGRLRLEFIGPRNWIRMPRTAVEYGLGTSMHVGRVIEDVLALMDPEIDFSSVDQMYVVFSNTAPRCLSGVLTWPKDYPVYQPDGRGLRAVLFSCPHAYDQMPGVITVHENGHAFGLPDLYPYDATGSLGGYAGVWDPMVGPAPNGMRDFIAGHKARLGWLDPGQIKAIAAGGIEEVIAPITGPGGTKAVAVPLNATAVLMAETRDGSGRDIGLCRTGVLLYVLDRSIPTGSGPVRVIPAHPDGDPDSDEIGRCGGLYNAPFQPGESYTHPNGITMEVLEQTSAGYRVRVRVPQN